jgi:hypothetical protein
MFMAAPVAERKAPSQGEVGQSLTANVNAYIAARYKMDTSVAKSDCVPGYDFNNGYLRQGIDNIRQAIESRTAADPSLLTPAAPLTVALDKLEIEAQKQFNSLLRGQDFDNAAWESKFKDIIAATKDDPNFKNVAAAAQELQSKGITNEMSRLNQSVENQKRSLDSERIAREVFGADHLLKKWHRCDNYQKAEYEQNRDNTNAATLTGNGNPGVGLDGSYRKEKSPYVIHKKEGKYNFTYSPTEDKWWQRSKDSNAKFNFKAAIRETFESMAVLGGHKKVTFDYPETSQEMFSKYHVANIQTAFQQAKEMLAERKAGKSNISVDFAIGAAAMDLLLHAPKHVITPEARDQLFREVKAFSADFAIAEQKFAQQDAQKNAPQDTTQVEKDDAKTPDEEVSAGLGEEGPDAAAEEEDLKAGLGEEGPDAEEIEKEEVEAGLGEQPEDESELDVDDIDLENADEEDEDNDNERRRGPSGPS